MLQDLTQSVYIPDDPENKMSEYLDLYHMWHKTCFVPVYAALLL